jgi:hypothetical protein
MCRQRPDGGWAVVSVAAVLLVVVPLGTWWAVRSSEIRTRGCRVAFA